MANEGSSAPQLSYAASFIKVGSRDWKIGEVIYSIGTTAVEKSKMRESFGDQWATALFEGVIVGKSATKKVRVRSTNLKVPEEIEYEFQHSIFKDPSAPPRKKAQKNVDQSQIAPLSAGGSPAVSNDDGAMEPYPSDPENFRIRRSSLWRRWNYFSQFCGNQWREDEALNSLDPRGPMAESLYLPSTYPRKIDLDLVDCVDLFFHKLLSNTRMPRFQMMLKNAKVEMLHLIGIMFTATICTMSNIQEYWNVKDDGSMLASRFYGKLNMSLSRFQFNFQTIRLPDSGRTRLLHLCRRIQRHMIIIIIIMIVLDRFLICLTRQQQLCFDAAVEL